MKIRDLAERAVWTFIQAFVAVLLGTAVIPDLSVTVLQTAALAGLGAVMALLSAVARDRLAVLPSPGGGLPGLPVKPDA